MQKIASETVVNVSVPVKNEYEFKYDAMNDNYSSTMEYNYLFIRSQRDWLISKCVHHGYVFLNEALDALGFARVPAGQVMGWVAEHGPVEIEFTRNDLDGSFTITLIPQGIIVNDI